MKRFLLALLFALSTASAFAYLPFTPTIRTGPAALEQSQPAVASNGFDYLTAWTTTGQFGSAVYTARITADGRVDGSARPADPTGFFVPDARPQSRAVSLTAGRDGYFLAWLSGSGLNAAITDSYGVIERKVVMTPSPAPEFAELSSTLAAWNGATHLALVRTNGPYNTPFFATVIDNNGEVVHELSLIGDTHGDPYVQLAVGGDDNGFLVLSTKTVGNRSDLYGLRLTSGGTGGQWVLLRSMASMVTGLAVTFDGTRDVVVWGDALGIWTMPVDTHTNAAGASRQLTSGSVAAVQNAVWNGEGLWIGYLAASGWKASIVTMSPSGAVSDPVGVEGYTPALASNGTRVLAVRPVWSATSDVDVIATFVTREGAGADFVASRSQTNQQNGELATDGTSLLAVWDEAVAPERQVFASILSPAHPSEPREITMSTGRQNAYPVASFNGHDYLVAWTRTDAEQKTEIVFRRLSRDGVLLDSSETVISVGAGPRVASDGRNWLVLWSRYEPNPRSCDLSGRTAKLYAARISSDGTVLDPGGIAVAPETTRHQSAGDAVWDGAQYVVAWQNGCSGYKQPIVTSISVATISADLSQITSSGVSAEAAKPGGGGGTVYGTPRAAATPGRIVIAWPATTTTPTPPWSSTSAIEYRVLNGIPVAHGRQRSTSLKPTAPAPIDASLVGVGHTDDGQLFILGKMTIPTAPLYQGLYRWNVSATGPASNNGLRFAFSGDEQLIGRPLPLGNSWWMPETFFSPDAGAYRLYARDFF